MNDINSDNEGAPVSTSSGQSRFTNRVDIDTNIFHFVQFCKLQFSPILGVAAMYEPFEYLIIQVEANSLIIQWPFSA